MDSVLWQSDEAELAKLSSATDILPDHYFVLRSRLGTQSPETALMCAVLEDALECFQRQFVSRTPRAKGLSQRSCKWFFADEPDWMFSFVSICAVLGLDPDQIRLGLMARYMPDKMDSPRDRLEHESDGASGGNR